MGGEKGEGLGGRDWEGGSEVGAGGRGRATWPFALQGGLQRGRFTTFLPPPRTLAVRFGLPAPLQDAAAGTTLPHNPSITGIPEGLARAVAAYGVPG